MNILQFLSLQWGLCDVISHLQSSWLLENILGSASPEVFKEIFFFNPFMRMLKSFLI